MINELELDGLEMEIYETLGIGSQNAITSTWFRDYKGISVRTLAEKVERLRLKGVPIGANRVGENKGYYIIDNEADRKATVAQYRSAINRMLRVANAMEKAVLINEGQLDLFKEEK